MGRWLGCLQARLRFCHMLCEHVSGTAGQLATCCHCAHTRCQCLCRPCCRRQLGEGGSSGLMDYSSPVDDVLRSAVEDLEAQNRTLQAENKRLRVEVVGAACLTLRCCSLSRVWVLWWKLCTWLPFAAIKQLCSSWHAPWICLEHTLVGPVVPSPLLHLLAKG